MKPLLLAALLITSLENPVLAQQYPSRPVTLVVPYAAGGATDVLGRTLGAEMARVLGQPVVVENRAGSAGVIGAAYVARAQPDGYTICLCGSGNLVLNPQINKTPYDPFRDLAPVVHVVNMPNVLVARKGLSATDLPSLVAAASSGSGLTFGSPGTAGTQHVAGELFARMTGMQLTHVPYKGEAPALTDLVGERIDLLFGTLSGTVPLIRTGEVKAIAVLSEARTPVLPDVPTAQELGVKGYAAYNWVGLNVPSGTSASVIDTLAKAANAALADAAFQTRLKTLMIEGVGGSSAAYAEFMNQEYRKWGDVIREAGVKPE